MQPLSLTTVHNKNNSSNPLEFEGLGRFSNCRHRAEPACAVIRLLEEGSITEERYATYMEILGEVEVEQAQNRSRGWKN